jgi:hypothetical protein
MPYVTYKDEGLISMLEAANRCKIENSRFWHLVRSLKLIPEPTTRRGGRFYYDPSEIKTVQTVVAKLRKEGKVK